MKPFSLLLLLLLSFQGISQESNNNTSTYFLIRHAEKDRTDASNPDPHLSEIGLKRANQWDSVFSQVPLDRIFSTDYFRTKETVAPIAKRFNIDIELYDPNNLDINTFLNDTKGQTVLIVGHSNTTPATTNALISQDKYLMMEDDNNSFLYIVVLFKETVTDYILTID
ncbi:histidine phosphatase family protein [Mangrovimonas sp. TPBH4]|uniref:SixA phosphatase family protein n=1 Tax=Mangrovimonas sp. TPBH4 TaxID=1645914 RepID=UPI0006B5D6EC|nr:histidine phosphatase family protein [Mangrovimonas sp. TPBH4]